MKFLAKIFFRGIISLVSGFSAAWVARLIWDQKVVSSNLTTPTIFLPKIIGLLISNAKLTFFNRKVKSVMLQLPQIKLNQGVVTMKKIFLTVFAVLLTVAQFSICAAASSILTYRAHVAGNGWQREVSEGEMAGTTGEHRQLEALVINLDDGRRSAIEY